MKTCSEQCLYCDVGLSVRHEHDHTPVPKRHGGKTTECVCLNCHDLKDRMDLDQWPMPAISNLFKGLNECEPSVRIFLARAIALVHDYDQTATEARAEADVLRAELAVVREKFRTACLDFIAADAAA